MRRLHDNELLKMAESLRSQIGSKVEASGANGVVIGLSGGIDSALVCKLCSDVVDTKCFMLPETGISSEEDLNDAKGLCEGLGVPYEIIDIHPVTRVIVDSYPSRIVPGSIQDINIRPRLRTLYLYICANDEHRLVAGTSNLTEINIGYCTKWGDNAADFLPIASLWKTEVRRLAELLEIPQAIIKKKPSAGLFLGQTDEGELGASYDIIDDILYESTVNRMTRSELYKLHDKATVDSLLDLVLRNAHKRSMPPSLETGL